jgi:acetyl-CoA acyltransferase
MPVSVQNTVPKGRRAVVVAGARTPFLRAFTGFLELDTVALGAAAVEGLLQQTSLDRSEVDSLIWGGVVLPGGAPNIGREIVLDLGLRPSIEAMTVSRACASGLQSVTLAAAAIERGEADVVIAGGSDSTSNAEVKMGQRFVHALAPVALGKRLALTDWLGVASNLLPLREILPQQPEIAERTTGELMGEAAERMAKRNQISRVDQDAFAVASHLKAAQAVEDGLLADDLVTVQTKKGPVSTDGLIRADTSAEKLARLRPVFDRKHGTLTAGNSSALTDGGAAVLLMSEEKAQALGYTPLAAFRSWSYVGVDPADQLLIGPALSMPRALDRAGMNLQDIDLVDIHEAFAAQVLCVLKALASDGWAKERLGRASAVGTVDPAKLNPLGGSLAFGHPFAATGARMVMMSAKELHRSGKNSALLGICAAGGLGAGAVLEAV